MLTLFELEFDVSFDFPSTSDRSKFVGHEMLQLSGK